MTPSAWPVAPTRVRPDHHLCHRPDSTITDRMVLKREEEDLPLWLGETWAPIGEVMALIRTKEMGEEWVMAPEKG